ncbi:hypothetical protein VFPFJ_01803 [Purpureocillium lilacinum]|uniref:Uncharacterized protein n=1 Tax=Purpureocillium lilacinum TaxID=33203 RepID=A0A179HRZ2_PURLI|nr:hypothetical protein VFPFJ_01803 [Purpureocillium lilacinum]OAQ92642.1 hypothetical protein VFPFJ_01803 [Purpureocillium lilacinum]
MPYGRVSQPYGRVSHAPFFLLRVRTESPRARAIRDALDFRVGRSWDVVSGCMYVLPVGDSGVLNPPCRRGAG